MSGTDSIRRDEVDGAVAVWKTLQCVQPNMDAAFETHGKGSGGRLSQTALRELLNELNEGITVPLAEVTAHSLLSPSPPLFNGARSLVAPPF